MFLSGYRILDLTDEKGYLCGRMLADLGADVIKVEKPGGDEGRNIGPFYHDEPHPEKSLYWWAYNANKRGITLDLPSKDGQELLIKLIETGHCLIESFPVGYLESLGLDYQTMSKINPKFVLVHITPFGSKGPWQDYKANDLIESALGGMMIWTGEPDKYPLRVNIPQSYMHAGGEASVATTIALYHAEVTGQGQEVDISILESWLATVANTLANWEFHQDILRREGKYRSGEAAQGVRMRNVWECKDGFVVSRIFGGGFGLKTNRGFTEWMREEGMINKLWQEMDWENFDMQKVTPELQASLEDQLMKFLKTKTKEELYTRAVKDGIQVAPVCTPKDLVENVQLKARGFWVEVEHPELGDKIIYPGSFARVPGIDIGIRRRAPLIGEHNLEVYGELGLSKDELVALKEIGTT
ncbi:CaiB/BaiF CoA transferase family protein [Chloroflexota bacterium]